MDLIKRFYGGVFLAAMSSSIGLAGGSGLLPGKEMTKPSSASGIQITGTLTPTPRKSFQPTTIKGYWNIDVVDDFTLPATKSITFCAAGRNLHVSADRTKLFRRGFSAIEKSRMVPEECNIDTHSKPAGWKSPLSQSQRSWILYQQYFSNPPFNIQWAYNSELAGSTNYTGSNSLEMAVGALRGSCELFGDCDPMNKVSTFGKIFLDIENDGISPSLMQEQINLYTYLAKSLKDVVSPKTETASIAPVPRNGHGLSPAADYSLPTEDLWDSKANHTATSRNRGMPDAIVGKSFADYIDVQMPGVYWVYPDFDYTASHTGDRDRHWLAVILQEQEVNIALSNKKRIAWQWLFNTQAPPTSYPNSGKSEHPAPPAIAEGLGIFYWFTGAYGSIFWDDAKDLIPNNPNPPIPGQTDDRNYACYEYYIHGLWRLFKHHGDMFTGGETYLNQQTECSYDGGQTWYKYNANELKTRGLPFVRAIVKGDQVLVAATKPYAGAGEKTTVHFRYTGNGYNFVTQINLTGDEIFLGRATMQDPNKVSASRKTYNLNLMSGCNCN